MFTATVVVSVVLAVLLVVAAVRKLTHQDKVVHSYERLGVPEHRLNQLAAILLLGAGGLIAGLFWAPIGIAAATGVTGYFLLAVGVHLRAHDRTGLPTPAAITSLAIAALLLRLATM